MNSYHTAPITTIILAGGRGQRMASADKGLIEWRGKPLIEHIVHQAEAFSSQIIINCNRNQEIYRNYSSTICSDDKADFSGPLAGIQAALPLANHSLCLICACDAPSLSVGIVSRLLKTLENDAIDACYCHDGNREQYLPLLLRGGLTKNLNDYLATVKQSGHSTEQGHARASLKGWYATLQTSTVNVEDISDAFLNLNTPEDFKR